MTDKKEDSITSKNRLETLVKEAEMELEIITPEIEYLEECVSKLDELKDRKHKLTSLIINLKSILPGQKLTSKNSSGASKSTSGHANNSRVPSVNKISIDTMNGRKVFVPEVALSDVKNLLRTRNNINYEIYKAIVFNTGEATTEEIKYYLVKNNIKRPKTGDGFGDVPLSEISSRINYLVRKNLLITTSSGTYSTVYGWEEAE